MRKPKLGTNKQLLISFIEFVTHEGKIVRFGTEAGKLFVQVNEVITYLTDVNRNIIGNILADVLVEKNTGAGITADGVLLKDGIVGGTTAHTSTGNGLTTGQLLGTTQFVTVTSASAANIISLPKAVNLPIGTKIRGMVNAAGFELRVHPDDMMTVKINNITTSVEAAIPADTSFVVELISATEWILTALTNLGAVVTAIVPDAV